jgi:hypothetical protein
MASTGLLLASRDATKSPTAHSTRAVAFARTRERHPPGFTRQLHQANTGSQRHRRQTAATPGVPSNVMPAGRSSATDELRRSASHRDELLLA